jgi:hypothetical protein
MPWPIDIRLVYKTLCEGNPARDILIGEICKTNEEQRKAVGKDKEITNKWVEEYLTTTHLTKTAAQSMQLKDPNIAPPHQMFPTVSSPYKVNSPPFNSTNLPNYLHIIIFGCGGQESCKNSSILPRTCHPTKCRQIKSVSTSNRVTYLTTSSWWFRLTRRSLPWPTHTHSFVST